MKRLVNVVSTEELSKLVSEVGLSLPCAPSVVTVVDFDSSEGDDYIWIALENILEQGPAPENFVVVAMNDVWTMGSMAVVERHCARQENILVLKFVEEQSQGARMNAGLDLACALGAKFVRFMKLDGLPDSEMYSRMIQEMESTGADVARCGARMRILSSGNESLLVPAGLSAWPDAEFDYAEPFYGDAAIDSAYGAMHGSEMKVVDLMMDAPDGVFGLSEFPQLLVHDTQVSTYVFRTKFLADEGIRWNENAELRADIPFVVEVLLKARIAIVKERLMEFCYSGAPSVEDGIRIARGCQEALRVLTEHCGHMDDLGKLGFALAGFAAVRNNVPYVLAMKAANGGSGSSAREQERLLRYRDVLGRLFVRFDDGDTLLDTANPFLNAQDEAFVTTFLRQWS